MLRNLSFFMIFYISKDINFLRFEEEQIMKRCKIENRIYYYLYMIHEIKEVIIEYWTFKVNAI